MKILITGGAGFIGSHLCNKYVKNGNIILCVDNFMNGNLSNVRNLLNLKNFKLINGDVTNIDLLEKVMRDIDVVLHLAAQIHVDRSITEPKLTYETNVIGTQNILEIARRYDVDKVIYSSSSEIYGSAQYVPMDEKHPLDAPHSYGASKIAADRMCHAYIQTYGMDICIMRSFNIFGPKQKDSGYGGVISLFTKRVLADMPPIVYGDGKQSRDYTYIEDTILSYDLVLKKKRPIKDAVNFGTGTEISILNLANKIIELCGKKGKIKPVHVEPRPGEVQRLIADNSKAKNIFGWVPKYSFIKGLEKFIDWYKSYRFEEWTKPR